MCQKYGKEELEYHKGKSSKQGQTNAEDIIHIDQTKITNLIMAHEEIL